MGRAGRHFLLALPCLVLLAMYAPTAHFFANQYDDAYITYRYAIHLAQGHGMVFNIGEHTDAASSFLYTLLLAGFWSAGWHDLEVVGALIGIASLAAITVLTWRLAWRASGSEGLALVVAVAAGCNGLLSGWTLSGMETLPWAALVLAAVESMTRRAAWPWTMVWVAAAAFTRFEGILLVPAWALSVWLSRSDEPSRAASQRWLPWGGMLAVVLAFLGFYAIKHAYYGVWISHAFAMKEIATYYRAAPLELARYWLLFVSVPAVFSVWSLPDRRLWPAWSYLLLSGAAVAMGPRSDWSRYSAHLIPLVYAFASVGLLALSRRFRGAGHAGLPWLSGGVVVLMLAQAGVAVAFNWQHMTVGAEHQACRKAMGEHIRTQISPDEAIASSDLGMLAYVAMEHRFVDLVALTSADVLADYQRGRNADEVLQAKHVRFIADTVSPRFDDRVNELRGQFPRVLQPSRFTVLTLSPSAGEAASGSAPAPFDCKAGPVGFRLAELVDHRRAQTADADR